MKVEIWKQYKDTNYEVSNLGNVRRIGAKKNRKIQDNGIGYCKVSLSKEGKKKFYLIHRLVAETFIPNPDNLPCVNHKDENKKNNCVNNLEWCSIEYNNAYGTRTEKTYKPVYCVELDRTFKSLTEAAKELGLSKGNITNCCKGRYKTTGGYHFRYKEVE